MPNNFNQENTVKIFSIDKFKRGEKLTKFIEDQTGQSKVDTELTLDELTALIQSDNKPDTKGGTQ